jgi:DNA-binding response OmpR family regulator
MRVLIADDDPVSSRVLAATLKRLGHEVEMAADGHEAWERHLAVPASVLITDWMMPRVDGLELTRRVRALAARRYTWIILLTAMRGRTSYLDGMEAGADDFVSKPINEHELHARLRVAERVLGLHRAVLQLEGLLPICSYCKRIRDEAERWAQVDDYVSRHTDAQFTHGICPDCYEHHLRPQLEQLAPTTPARPV